MPDREFSQYNDWPDAVLVVDRTGSIAFANSLAERLFDHEAGALVGTSLELLIPERHRGGHPMLREEFFCNPRVLSMGAGREVLGLRGDGHEIPLEIALGPAADGGYAVAAIRDIADIVESRTALRSSESRLREAQRIGKIGSWEWDIVENTVSWSAEIYLLFGLDAAICEPSYEAFLERIHPEDRQLVQDDVHRALDSHGTTHSIDHRIVLADGSERFVSSQGSATFDETGRPTRMAGTVQDITERILAKKALESTLKEVGRLKDRLQEEQEYLREEIKSDHDFDDIIGRGEAIQTTFDAVRRVAGTDATVLLLGETGTGKELFGRAIHAKSQRSERVLIKVDCTTLPSGLVESELFGHVKGAFTGADASRAGRFELANGGTIFLDEIGELSVELQAKLLRVLQDGEIQCLGAQEVQKVDVRVIAATNRNLRREVEEGRFRADLFYRLNVFPIEIPPLRHRREDIATLTTFFVSKCAARLGRRIKRVPLGAQRALAAYDWPGNVRELQNVIERSVILSPGSELKLADNLGGRSVRSHEASPSLKQDLEDIARGDILRTLKDCNWKIKGEGNAASRLGLNPSTLRSRMKRLGISRPSSSIQ